MSLNNTRSSTRNRNGALDYSTRASTSNPARKSQEWQDDSLTEFLRSRGREGFASSAYWGATGEVPPREPDDVAAADAFGFRDEVDRRLVRFPKDKTSFPRTMDYTLIGLHHIGETPNGDNGGMNAAQLRQLQGSDGVQLTDDGNGGVRVKPRMLNTLTSTQRMRGDFDDGVLQALRDGQAREEELLRQLEETRSAPFVSAEPDAYCVNSNDLCDFSNVDPKSYRVTEVVPTTRTRRGGSDGTVPTHGRRSGHSSSNGESSEEGAGPAGMYRSRHANVEREGPKRRESALQDMQRSRDIDPDQLRAAASESHAQSMPRGWKGYSAKGWQSTSHREHAPYDVAAAAKMNERDATVPLRNKNYELNADDEQAVRLHDERAASRRASRCTAD